VVARRRSAVAAGTATAKRHTILTLLIDAGFLSDKEKVFYVPVDGGEAKVVSGAVTRTGVHCGCCDAVVSLPAFEAHAGRDDPGQQQRSWEKLLLVSGSSLLNRMQEAWEKEKPTTADACCEPVTAPAPARLTPMTAPRGRRPAADATGEGDGRWVASAVPSQT